MCDLEGEKNTITSVTWSEKVCLSLLKGNLVTKSEREREREREGEGERKR